MKSTKFIKNILKDELKRTRKSLKKNMEDNGIALETYKNTLEKCNKLEYAIKEMENFT